ncbi:hypothetical protein CCP3SC1_70060 [Gammaproteobacteria bacterium]
MSSGDFNSYFSGTAPGAGSAGGVAGVSGVGAEPNNELLDAAGVTEAAGAGVGAEPNNELLDATGADDAAGAAGVAGESAIGINLLNHFLIRAWTVFL